MGRICNCAQVPHGAVSACWAQTRNRTQTPRSAIAALLLTIPLLRPRACSKRRLMRPHANMEVLIMNYPFANTVRLCFHDQHLNHQFVVSCTCHQPGACNGHQSQRPSSAQEKLLLTRHSESYIANQTMLDYVFVLVCVN